MSRARLPRIYELLDGPSKTNRRRAYVRHVETVIAGEPARLKQLDGIEADLNGLDETAWHYISAEIAGKFAQPDPQRGWQQAIDILNEAKACAYLRRLGCSDLVFVPASTTKTPDLRAKLGIFTVLCEVKTIRAGSGTAFLKKLASRLDDAEEQMASFSADATARRIIYVVLHFDDLLPEQASACLRQVQEVVAARRPSPVEIVIDGAPSRTTYLPGTGSVSR